MFNKKNRLESTEQKIEQNERDNQTSHEDDVVVLRVKTGVRAGNRCPFV